MLGSNNVPNLIEIWISGTKVGNWKDKINPLLWIFVTCRFWFFVGVMFWWFWWFLWGDGVMGWCYDVMTAFVWHYDGVMVLMILMVLMVLMGWRQSLLGINHKNQRNQRRKESLQRDGTQIRACLNFHDCAKAGKFCSEQDIFCTEWLGRCGQSGEV